jgi:putative tryptophan/tyrosine transport system substrate-binding protein
MWRSTVGCIVTFTLSILVAPLVAEAQQTGKAYRIDCLAERRVLPTPDWLEVMRLLGYVEGHNLFFECRNAETREQLRACAAELVTRQVDLIVTLGTPATLAAKQATSTIPAERAGRQLRAAEREPHGDRLGPP